MRRSPIGEIMQDDLDLRDFDGQTRLFPLDGVVMFPHVVLPLHIFEPRYRQMTRDALGSDRLITIIQAKPPEVWTPDAEPALEPVGCLGRILDHEMLPDGRYNFLLLGLTRVRIVEELHAETLYRQARVEILRDAPASAASEPVRSYLIELVRSRVKLSSEVSKLIRGNIALGTLTDLLSQALGLPAPLRQELLNEPCPHQRAVMLTNHLEGPNQPERPFPPPFSMN